MEEADVQSMEQRFNAKLEALEQRMDAKLETMFLRIAALLPAGTTPNADVDAKTSSPKRLEVPAVPKEQNSDPGDPEVPLSAFRSPLPDRDVFEVPRSSDVQYFQQTAVMDRRTSNRGFFGVQPPKEYGGMDDGLILLKDDDVPVRDRRASLIRPMDLAGVVPQTAISVYRDQPSFAHIKLEDLTVNQVFQFWTDILQYQTMYGIGLKPTTLVSRDARLTIMSKGKIRSEIEFFQLSDKHLRQYIQHAVRPTDKVMFATTLEESLWFWPKGEDNFVLSIETFQKFYDRLQTYRQEFYQKYEFLAFNNAENVPKLDNKKHGLIYIFLQKIPEEYAQPAFTQLPKSRFDSLEEFLKFFYGLAHTIYQKSIEAREVNTFFGMGAKRNAPKRDGANPMIPPKKSEPASIGDDEPGDPSSALHAFGGMSRGAPLRAPPRPPAAPPEPPSAPKGPDGCFRALTDGKCSKPNCSFNHTLPVLQATYEELIMKLNKKLWRARPANAIFEPNGAVPPDPPPMNGGRY